VFGIVMPDILKRREESACSLIGTSDDGSKKWVCQVDESKIFEVTTNKEGEIKEVNPKTVLMTPEDYKKVYNALKRQISPI
jgi:hypothetical protein